MCVMFQLKVAGTLLRVATIGIMFELRVAET